MPSYFDAVLKHEAVFTEHFTERGYSCDVAYPSADYPTDHPALFNPELLLADGCPILKRRPFFHYPPFLDRHAVIGRQILQNVAGYGYPTEVILQDLARNVAPKVMNTDVGMLEVLPDVGRPDSGIPTPRILVAAHVPAARRTAGLLAKIARIPAPFDLVVTTTDAEGLAAVEASVADAVLPFAQAREVRAVPEGSGRDMGAFFVGCRDLLRSGDYELVVKVHARTPRKRDPNVSRYFRKYQLSNLLGTPDYIDNLLELFRRERGLGVVFPPPMHIGYATPGRGWQHYREAGEEIAERLAIKVPFDGVSPLAPLGGMWVARVDALRILIDHDWTYGDFRRGGRRGADLSRVLERMIPLAAGERGFHSRTVLNTEHAAISHVSLEYKVDQLSSTTPGYPVEQIQFFHRAGWMGFGGAAAMTRMYMRINHPRVLIVLAPVLRPADRIARGVLRRVKPVVRRLRGLPPLKEAKA